MRTLSLGIKLRIGITGGF